jgi:N-acetylglutamate synthase-like GNAT family acetyltransferase
MKPAVTIKDVRLRKAGDADKNTIRKLLETVNLPVESVDSGATTFYIAEENSIVIGIAGFEFYGKDVLLRSVAVPPELQKQGIGEHIVDLMISIARDRHINRVVLLTETAERFFSKKGFKVVDRSSIDNVSMKQSSEFTFACPTSAVCMVLHI